VTMAVIVRVTGMVPTTMVVALVVRVRVLHRSSARARILARAN
jgi:hypothetical protein